MANSNKEKYAAEKEKADADFKKASDYLGEAVAVSPERPELAKLLNQVKASIK